MYRTVVLATMILHAQVYVADDRDLFPRLISIFNDVRRTYPRAHASAGISAHAFFLIKNKL